MKQSTEIPWIITKRHIQDNIVKENGYYLKARFKNCRNFKGTLHYCKSKGNNTVLLKNLKDPTPKSSPLHLANRKKCKKHMRADQMENHIQEAEQQN